MLYNIIEHIASALDALVILVFLNFIFTHKRNNVVISGVFVALEYLCAQYLVEYVYLQVICTIVMICGYCFVSLKGKYSHHIIWSIMCLAICTIVNQTAMSLISLITGRPIQVLLTMGEVLRVYSIVVCKILQILTFFVIALLIKRKKYTYKHRFECVIVILLLVINLLVILGFLSLNINLKLSGYTQLIWLWISFVIVGMLIICILLIFKISSLNATTMSNKLLAQQVEAQKEMIEKAYLSQNETMLLRHDMKHYVTIWLNEAQSMDIEALKAGMLKYLNRLDSVAERITYISENKLINSVLYEKKRSCDKNLIRCEYKIQCKLNVSEEMEIAVIIANLMDNAIRAELNELQEQRYIRLDIFEYNDRYNIIVSNYISKSVLKKNVNLETTKKNYNQHGYGVKSVKKLTREYGGIVNISEDANRFVVHIQI